MTTKTQSDALICASELIFDRASFDTEIETALAGADAAGETRKSVMVTALKARYADGHAAISDAFLASPKSARQTVRSYAYLAEENILPCCSLVGRGGGKWRRFRTSTCCL